MVLQTKIDKGEAKSLTLKPEDHAELDRQGMLICITKFKPEINNRSHWEGLHVLKVYPAVTKIQTTEYGYSNDFPFPEERGSLKLMPFMAYVLTSTASRPIQVRSTRFSLFYYPFAGVGQLERRVKQALSSQKLDWYHLHHFDLKC